MESCHQAKREKKKETAGDEDYELECGDDDDDGGGVDDMAELMDVGLAYLEDEKKRKETEGKKLDIVTGGDEATEGDYKERDWGCCVFFKKGAVSKQNRVRLFKKK